MAKKKKKSQGEATLHVFRATTLQGTRREFSVHVKDGQYCINSVTKEGVVEQLCHPGVQTEDDITREIGLVFNVSDVIRVRWT